jgi:hypothetical protein
MQLTRSHRLRGCAVVLAIATLLALAAPVRPLQAQTEDTIKVLSYNAAGAARQRPDHSEDKDPLFFIDVLAKRIAAEQPQLVGLQEMCGRQVNYLEKALASRAYPMVAHFIGGNTKDSRCPSVEGPWLSTSVGKAVLAVGAATAERPSPQVNVCPRWEKSQVPILFCSVHTKPEEGGGRSGPQRAP